MLSASLADLKFRSNDPTLASAVKVSHSPHSYIVPKDIILLHSQQEAACLSFQSGSNQSNSFTLAISFIVLLALKKTLFGNTNTPCRLIEAGFDLRREDMSDMAADLAQPTQLLLQSLHASPEWAESKPSCSPLWSEIQLARCLSPLLFPIIFCCLLSSSISKVPFISSSFLLVLILPTPVIVPQVLTGKKRWPWLLAWKLAFGQKVNYQLTCSLHFCFAFS